MLRLFAIVLVLAGVMLVTEDAEAAAKDPRVVIKTSMGKIVVELWPDRAPITVKNFLRYVDAKFYNDLIFHRVIGNFMIQGGGFDKTMKQKQTLFPPIKNEARADCSNARGTIAMARTQIVDSATGQFYINVVDNGALDHKDNTDRGFGYCVFGKVVEGMDVVDKIRKVRTGVRAGHPDVPVEPVIIEKIKRKDQE
jgi:cyclophilin family peptidyl-prolyl cis-trans isomerase